MAKKLYYKIGEACKNLDIQPYVLRYWETEFPMLKPDKSSSGQRVYSDKDLSTIRRIKELLYDEGYTIAGAKKKLETEDPNDRPAPLKVVEDADQPKKKAPAKKAAAKKAPAKKAAPKKAASKAKKTAASSDADRLREGIESALVEAREVLQLLDSK